MDVGMTGLGARGKRRGDLFQRAVPHPDESDLSLGKGIDIYNWSTQKSGSARSARSASRYDCDAPVAGILEEPSDGGADAARAHQHEGEGVRRRLCHRDHSLQSTRGTGRNPNEKLRPSPPSRNSQQS
jgi:hypothetical protein